MSVGGEGVLWPRGVLSEHRTSCTTRIVGNVARYLESVAMQRYMCGGAKVRRQQYVSEEVRPVRRVKESTNDMRQVVEGASQLTSLRKHRHRHSGGASIKKVRGETAHKYPAAE